MEAKFKVGEVVRVKDLKSMYDGERRVPFSLNSHMFEYSGQLFSVEAVKTNCYKRSEFPDFPDCDECLYVLSTLDGNTIGWSWSSPMLEKIDTTQVEYPTAVDTKVDAGPRKSWYELAQLHRDMLTSIASMPRHIIEASKPKAKDEPLKLAIKKRKIKLNFKN